MGEQDYRTLRSNPKTKRHHICEYETLFSTLKSENLGLDTGVNIENRYHDYNISSVQ